MESQGGSMPALLYADIDELRSVTRQIFVEESHSRPHSSMPLGRRPEVSIREELILALNIAMTDSIDRRPFGLR